MHALAKFNPDLAPLEANIASTRVWLVELALDLADALAASNIPGLRDVAHAALKALRPRLHRELCEAARLVRALVLTKAVMELDLRWPAHRLRRRTPHLVRTQRYRDTMRAITNAALRGLNRGSLSERAARLKEIIDDPGPTIARIIARIHRVRGRLRTTRFIHARPANESARSLPAPRRLCAADTS